MRLQVCAISLYIVVSVPACPPAFAATSTPQILLGVPQPVAGTTFTVDVLVEAVADVAPLATGSVTVSWGDGTTEAVATLSNSLVTAEHSYSAAGSYTITANYGGDSNYSAASTSQQIVALASAPPAATLSTYGDSITYGDGASAPAYAYADVTAATEGWTLHNYGVPGDDSIDTCETINQTSFFPLTAYDTFFTGENDLRHAMISPAGEAEYTAAVTSCSVWLMTTLGYSRSNASSTNNTVTGTWTPTTLYTGTGLNTTVAGSTLAGTFTGNVFYAQLSITQTTNYTVSISIDGGAAKTYTPPVLNYVGNRVDYGPYPSRIPLAGANTTTHTVKFTCVTPGSAGCYVDWFAGNGPTLSSVAPILWLGTPYFTGQPGYPQSEYTQMAQLVRNVEAQLAGDGLPVHLADLGNWFQGPSDPTCMYDEVHPSDCGHAILAAVFVNSMNVLAPTSSRTAAKAVVSASPNPAGIGQAVTVTATVTGEGAGGTPTGTATYYYEGQPLGSATLKSGVATFQAGTVGLPPGIYPVTASYSGDANFTAATSEPYNVTLVPAATTTVVTATPSIVTPAGDVTLTATVARAAGEGFPTGMVTFLYRTMSLGTAPLNGKGVATLSASTSGIPAGSYAVTARYGGDSADAASKSSAVTVTVK
jgi:hypothetical protein